MTQKKTKQNISKGLRPKTTNVRTTLHTVSGNKGYQGHSIVTLDLITSLIQHNKTPMKVSIITHEGFPPCSTDEERKNTTLVGN